MAAWNPWRPFPEISFNPIKIMTTQPSAPDSVSAWNLAKSVLTSKSASATVHLLSPGAVLPETVGSGSTELVLYVAQGGLVATIGPGNFILNCDETLLVPANRPWSVRNTGPIPAKLFVLVLPAPRIEVAPVVFPA